jgi:hypothetical protein
VRAQLAKLAAANAAHLQKRSAQQSQKKDPGKPVV